jgi:hypothetical protein
MSKPIPHPSGSHPRPSRRLGAACLASAWAFGLAGCLYTTQHFNTGRLLEPGETAVTFGLGKAHYYREDCPDGYYGSYDGSGEVAGTGTDKTVCRKAYVYDGMAPAQPGADSVRPLERIREDIPKASLGYRLGVRKRWGPLTGIELGWNLEGPTNPISLEFDLKAGLPMPSRWKASHSLSAGWGVGAWVDNTWFAEYAAAREFGKSALFASYRYSALATQPENLDSSSRAGHFVRFPRSAHQFSLGWYQRVPALPVVPDYLVPEFTLTLPVYRGDLRELRPPALDLNFNVGVGWDF